MNYSPEEQCALDTGELSNIHEWTDADGVIHRCWDRVYRKSLAEVREYHREAVAGNEATDEELDALLTELLDLGIIEQAGPREFLVHYGKIVRDGKVVPFDLLADDDDDGPPEPVLSAGELEKAAVMIRRKLPAHMWGTLFALRLASGTEGTTTATHAAMAGLSHRHAHAYSMPEVDLATMERVLPELESLGLVKVS